MSSVASKFGTSGMAHYSSVKSTINTATKCLATELASRKIRVNCIISGAIKTPMHDRLLSGMSNKSIQEYEDKHLLGFGKPSDIANAVTYLLSSSSEWITGSEIYIDGGYSCFK